MTAANSNGNIVVSWSGSDVGVGTSPTFYSQCSLSANEPLAYTNACPASTASCLTSGAGSYSIGPVYADTTYYCKAALNSSSGANHDASAEIQVNTTTGL